MNARDKNAYVDEPTKEIAERVEAIDWARVAIDLDITVRCRVQARRAASQYPRRTFVRPRPIPALRAARSEAERAVQGDRRRAPGSIGRASGRIRAGRRTQFPSVARRQWSARPTRRELVGVYGPQHRKKPYRWRRPRRRFVLNLSCARDRLLDHVVSASRVISQKARVPAQLWQCGKQVVGEEWHR